MKTTADIVHDDGHVCFECLALEIAYSCARADIEQFCDLIRTDEDGSEWFDTGTASSELVMQIATSVLFLRLGGWILVDKSDPRVMKVLDPVKQESGGDHALH